MSTKRRALAAALMTPLTVIILSCLVGAVLDQGLWLAAVLGVGFVAVLAFCGGVAMALGE